MNWFGSNYPMVEKNNVNKFEVTLILHIKNNFSWPKETLNLAGLHGPRHDKLNLVVFKGFLQSLGHKVKYLGQGQI
jgi:hypothetical protein